MIAMMLPQGYFAQRYNLIGKVRILKMRVACNTVAARLSSNIQIFAANVFCYGIVMFGMSGVKNAGGLMATRFFLGMCEGTNPSLGGLLVSEPRRLPSTATIIHP